MAEPCIPHNGVRGALVCKCCSCCKVQCLHVGPSATVAPSTNVVGWTGAVCEGVELVMDVMDGQTEVLEVFIGEMCGLGQAVECLSSSSTSSLQGAVSGDEE